MKYLKPLAKIVEQISACIVLIFTVFGFLIFLLYFANMPFHDLAFWRMHTALASVQHPDESKTLEWHDFFGSRYTNTAECTYAVGEFRSAILSRDEILNAYKNASAGKYPVQIFIVDGYSPLSLDNPADTWLAEFEETHATSTVTYYLLYLYKPHQPWWGDWRCDETGFEDGKEISSPWLE